jgi:hypothetical protein
MTGAVCGTLLLLLTIMDSLRGNCSFPRNGIYLHVTFFVANLSLGYEFPLKFLKNSKYFVGESFHCKILGSY